MPQPPITPKPVPNNAGDNSWLLDENISPGLIHNSMHDLNISDSPLTQPLRSAAPSNNAAASRVKKPMKARPSWGSAAVLDSNGSAKAMGKMRLLAGLNGNDENKPPVARGGGAGRPRFSLFAKQGVPTGLAAKKKGKQAQEEDDDDVTIHGLGSTLADSTQLASSSVVDGTSEDGDDEYIREALSGKRSSARQSTGGPTPAESKESQEQTARQLNEIRKMNEVFEAYETMLRGSAGQINAFAQRVQETDDLLNIYIGLLRQTEKTAQLIMDPDWKGSSEDATAHALSVALAERETQRLQAEAQAQEEAAERAAQDAARKAAEEERERAEGNRRAASGAGRGRGRVVSGATRGATARGGTTRTASTATARGGRPAAAATSSTTRGGSAPRGGSNATRGRSASAAGLNAGRGAAPPPSATGTSRPSGIPTRSTSGSAGLGGQYANVRSSGYGPR